MGIFNSRREKRNPQPLCDPLDEPGRVVRFRCIKLWLRARYPLEMPSPPSESSFSAQSKTLIYAEKPAISKSSGTPIETCPHTSPLQKKKQIEPDHLTQPTYALFDKMRKWAIYARSYPLIDRIITNLKRRLKNLEETQTPTAEELKAAQDYQKKSSSEKAQVENSEKNFFLNVFRGLIFMFILIGIILRQCS